MRKSNRSVSGLFFPFFFSAAFLFILVVRTEEEEKKEMVGNITLIWLLPSTRGTVGGR